MSSAIVRACPFSATCCYGMDIASCHFAACVRLLTAVLGYMIRVLYRVKNICELVILRHRYCTSVYWTIVAVEDTIGLTNNVLSYILLIIFGVWGSRWVLESVSSKALLTRP